MNINRILSEYHDNIKMADSLNMEVSQYVSISYGQWDFNNYVLFRRGDFRFNISKELFVCIYLLEVSIWIDDIQVYKNGWKHKIPVEMKNKIKDTLLEIKLINKEYKRLKLKKIYNKKQKSLELQKKQIKQQTFEREKQYLDNKYK